MSATLQDLRVLFVVPSLGLGGSERQAFLFARHLHDREHADVRMLGMTHIRGGIADRCVKAGIKHDFFRLRHAYGTRLDQALDVLRFARYVRQHRIDILLPYCMFQNVLCSLVSRVTGAAVCVWNQRDEGRLRMEPWLERIAIRQPNCFISNSRHGATFLTDTLRVAPNRVHLVPNGIETGVPVRTRAEWRRSLEIGETDFVSAMVANLHRFKDHTTLVQSWVIVRDTLQARGQSAHLLLAGAPGDMSDSLTARVKALGLERHVHFLGAVDDVPGLLEASDLAVFSSCAEGVPNAVIEAMAAGLAVVATDYPGMREALGESAGSLLARSRDPDDLAAKILTAASDPGLRLRLGQAGRTRVAAEFSLERMCTRMTELVRNEWVRRNRVHAHLRTSQSSC